MDIEALAALASNALVTAAVTDTWEDLRHKIARLFGRGQPDPQIEKRLQETQQRLNAMAPTEREHVRAALAGQWQTRFADLLADFPEAADELDAVVREINANISAPSSHSAVAGRDIFARADHGAVAASVINGNVTAGPTMPDPASN